MVRVHGIVAKYAKASAQRQVVRQMYYNTA